jgi:peptide/nickel transport system permease protein
MTDALHRLLRTPQGVLGLVLLAVLVLVCILGSTLAPYSPESMDFAGRFAAPGVKHWLGADQLGRDVLSRLLVGARSTVPLAVAATFSGAAIGACVGTLSAYLGGRWDEAITRTIDAVMAVPHLLLALILVSTLGKGSTPTQRLPLPSPSPPAWPASRARWPLRCGNRIMSRLPLRAAKAAGGSYCAKCCQMSPRR